MAKLVRMMRVCSHPRDLLRAEVGGGWFFNRHSIFFRMYIFVTKISQLSRSRNFCLLAACILSIICVVGWHAGSALYAAVRDRKYFIFNLSSNKRFHRTQFVISWQFSFYASFSFSELWFSGHHPPHIYLNQLSSLLWHNCSRYS